MEEGRPVDVVANLAQGQVLDHAGAGEGGGGDVDRLPVGGEAAAAAFLEGEERLRGLLALVGDAGPLVFEPVVGDEGGALRVAEERADDADGAGGVEDMDGRIGVVMGDLDRGVGLAGGGAADEEREGEAFALHLAGDVNHLVERGGDEAAEADNIDVELAGGGEDFFARDHDAEVDDLVVIAGEHDADDVLADVVDVALDGGEEDLALGLLVAGALFFLLHEGHEVGDRFFHDAGAFDDLGQEHFALAEKIADDAHAFHERAFDHFQRGGVFLARFLGIGIDEIDDALDQGVAEPFLDREGAPLRFFLRHGLVDLLVTIGEGDEALGGVGASVEDHVLDQLACSCGSISS